MGGEYQQRIRSVTTVYGCEDNGVWTLADVTGKGRLDLVYIKTQDVQSGNIELHIASAESNYQERLLDIPTSRTAEGNGNDSGYWLMRDMNGDGRADLVQIKTRGTSTNKVEVHVLSAASNYRDYLIQTASSEDVDTAHDGLWSISEKGDLVYIKTRNTGTSTVELHILSRASNFQNYVVHTGTTFGCEDNGTWTLSPTHGDYPHLIFIKTRHVGGANAEVYITNADKEWKTRDVETSTALLAEDNGNWSVANYTNSWDVVYIKTRNTSSGRVEIHGARLKPNEMDFYTNGARNVRLHGQILSADLPRANRSWNHVSIDFDSFIQWDVSYLMFGDKGGALSDPQTVKAELVHEATFLQLTTEKWDVIKTVKIPLFTGLFNDDGEFYVDIRKGNHEAARCRPYTIDGYNLNCWVYLEGQRELRVRKLDLDKCFRATPNDLSHLSTEHWAPSSFLSSRMDRTILSIRSDDGHIVHEKRTEDRLIYDHTGDTDHEVDANIRRRDGIVEWVHDPFDSSEKPEWFQKIVDIVSLVGAQGEPTPAAVETAIKSMSDQILDWKGSDMKQWLKGTYIDNGRLIRPATGGSVQVVSSLSSTQ